DLTGVDGPCLIDEGRVSGDDEKPPDTTERRDDILDDAVREVVGLGIAAEVLERKYCERGAIRQGPARRNPAWRGRPQCDCRRARLDLIGPDGTPDVL